MALSPMLFLQCDLKASPIQREDQGPIPLILEWALTVLGNRVHKLHCDIWGEIMKLPCVSILLCWDICFWKPATMFKEAQTVPGDHRERPCLGILDKTAHRTTYKMCAWGHLSVTVAPSKELRLAFILAETQDMVEQKPSFPTVLCTNSYRIYKQNKIVLQG